MLELTVSESKCVCKYLGTNVRKAVTMENSNVAAHVTHMNIPLVKRERKAFGNSEIKPVMDNDITMYLARVVNQSKNVRLPTLDSTPSLSKISGSLFKILILIV